MAESDSVFSCAVCERQTSGFPLHCAFCDEELSEPGALLISPPQEGSSRGAWKVVKMHICRRCYNRLDVNHHG